MFETFMKLKAEETSIHRNLEKHIASFVPGIAKVYMSLMKDPILVMETYNFVKDTQKRGVELLQRWGKSATVSELKEFAKDCEEKATRSDLALQLNRIFNDTEERELLLKQAQIEINVLRVQQQRADESQSKVLREERSPFGMYWNDRTKEFLAQNQSIDTLSVDELTNRIEEARKLQGKLSRYEC